MTCSGSLGSADEKKRRRSPLTQLKIETKTGTSWPAPVFPPVKGRTASAIIGREEGSWGGLGLVVDIIILLQRLQPRTTHRLGRLGRCMDRPVPRGPIALAHT